MIAAFLGLPVTFPQIVLIVVAATVITLLIRPWPHEEAADRFGAGRTAREHPSTGAPEATTWVKTGADNPSRGGSSTGERDLAKVEAAGSIPARRFTRSAG